MHRTPAAVPRRFLREAVRRLACAAAVLPLAWAAPAQASLSDGVLKIGVLTDMSGPYSDFVGKGAVIAARMAIDDFGGRMFGKDIVLVEADHLSKADVGKNVAQRWFDVEKVDAAFELNNSSVALAVTALGRDRNRITVVTGAASSRITNEDCAPATSLHWVYDTHSLANVVGKAIVRIGGKRWFFLTADYAFGHSLERDTSNVVRAAGGTVVGGVRHPLDVGDFSSFLLQAQASKADIVALANAGTDTVNSIKSATEFGIPKKQRLVTLLLGISAVHALGLPAAQDLYMAEGWYWDTNDETRAFGRRFAALHNGRMPNAIHTGVYSSVSHYLKAVRTAGTDDTAKVMKAMHAAPVNDVFTKNGRIREDGLMQHDVYLFQVKKPAESKAPWDYLKLVETVKGEDAFQPLSQTRCPALLAKGRA
ncbi:MAG: ABC transporter substrate-binding protein [Betaproteobacteria bacterium]|nr:ABC transporter substrate-binding protein [Betaproteobacteria bacterium]